MVMKKIQDILYGGILTLFMIMIVGILALVFVFHPQIDYLCKKEFILSNITMLLLIIFGVFIFVGLLKITSRYSIIKSLLFNRSSIRWAVFFLFLIQIYISYNIYFDTMWDSGLIVENARMIAEGKTDILANSYFSMYPNNIFLVWFYSMIFKLNLAFGIFAAADDLMSIIFIQCLLSSFTGYLVWVCTKRSTNNGLIAWFALLIYVILVGISPWMTIPYSDACGIIFPVSIFYLYQINVAGIKSYMKWGGIALLSYWGYRIKPQIIIIFIAIIIVELLKGLTKKFTKEEIKKYLLMVCILGAVIFLSSGLYSIIEKDTGIKIDKNGQFTLTHFAMMGLNYDTDGTFYDMDVYYSESFPTVAERQAGNLKVIKQRIAEYGFGKVLNHTARKLLVTYGDGTFAWGNEGGFYYKLHDDKNNVVSPFLKSIYYNNGKYFKVYSTVLQFVWIFVLVGLTGVVFFFKSNIQKNSKVLVLILSLIGLTLFEVLFEARARYLYTYVPCFIILAVLGWRNYIRFILVKLKTKVKGSLKGSVNNETT